MSGSLDWVECPMCGYEAACLDFELQDGSTVLACTRCTYSSENGLVFHFIYRNEFRITTTGKDQEEAYNKAESGQWINVTIDSECGLWPEYLVLEEEE